MDDLGSAVGSATWGQDVLDAVQEHFASRQLRDPMVHLVDATLGVTNDGDPAVVIIYDHPWYDRRVGLRSRLDQAPMSMYEGMSTAEARAHDIAEYEISQPLGSHFDRLVEDDSGVWWWQSPIDE